MHVPMVVKPKDRVLPRTTDLESTPPQIDNRVSSSWHGKKGKYKRNRERERDRERERPND